MELFDMHCHVDLMPDMVTFAKQTLDASVGIFAVTTTPKAYAQETQMLQSFPNIRVGLGLHPQLVSKRYGELFLFEKHIEEAEFVGEIGLDFNKQYYSSKEKQLDVFHQMIEWCSRFSGKTISIHSVHSDKATLDILERYACMERNHCILHWFSGSLAQLHRAVEMGCYFSVNNAMAKSTNGQNLLANIPIEKLLIETDAPFVSEIKTVSRLKAEMSAVNVTLQAILNCEVEAQIPETSRTLLKL